MTPYEEAQAVARRVGLDFHAALHEHLERGYVYSSPDCFILAINVWREFGESRHEESAIFVTLATGNLYEFLEIDPMKETRKWLGFVREDGGETHWLDFQRLRRRGAKRASIPAA